MAAHAGELARRVQNQYRETGTLQAAGRGRSVYREDPPTIVIASEAVPEGIIVDEVVGFDDLGGQKSRLFDAARLCGGLIEAHMLAEFAAHLGDVPRFERMIEVFIEANAPIRARYHRITAALEDGTERIIYAPGHLKDWKRAIVDALKQTGLKGHLHSAVPCECVVEAAEAPMPDKVDMVVAALDPANVEAVELGRLAGIAMVRGNWRLQQPVSGSMVPLAYRAGEGLFAEHTASLGAFVALQALQDAWVRTGRMSQERALALGFTYVVDTYGADGIQMANAGEDAVAA